MTSFPKLPSYRFFWRSIQIEPIPNSGERITIGAVIQGYDRALIVTKFISNGKLANIFGNTYAQRLSKALSITIDSAENFFSKNDINKDWRAPVDGLFINRTKESLAENIEEGAIIAARNDAFFSINIDEKKQIEEKQTYTFNAQTWRKEVLGTIKSIRENLEEYFEKSISLSGSGLPFKFGFISTNYAAHFDAITQNKSHRQESLIRAQSKLWQLDRLRDSNQLFHQEKYELVLYRPETNDEYLIDFIEELKLEASRRNIHIYTSDNVVKTAKHIIESAA